MLGILHNSTDQVIIDHTNQTLKLQLTWLKEGETRVMWLRYCIRCWQCLTSQQLLCNFLGSGVGCLDLLNDDHGSSRMGSRVCLYFHKSQNPLNSCLSGLAVVASCCCLYFCSCCWEWACPRLRWEGVTARPKRILLSWLQCECSFGHRQNPLGNEEHSRLNVPLNEG